MGRIRNAIPNLAAIRKSRGLSLHQISDATKIAAFYLHAIEDGNVEKLPPGVYARSYIRQYARAVDFNEDELLERFGLALREQPDTQPAAGPPRLKRWMEWLSPLFHIREAGSRRTG